MKSRERSYLWKKKIIRKVTNTLVEEVRKSIDKEILDKIIDLTEIPFEMINKE